MHNLTSHHEYRAIRGYADVGDQSRYFDLDAWAKHHGFLDVPKASKNERERGLQGIKPKKKYYCDNRPQSLSLKELLLKKLEEIAQTKEMTSSGLIHMILWGYVDQHEVSE